MNLIESQADQKYRSWNPRNLFKIAGVCSISSMLVGGSYYLIKSTANQLPASQFYFKSIGVSQLGLAAINFWCLKSLFYKIDSYHSFPLSPSVQLAPDNDGRPPPVSSLSPETNNLITQISVWSALGLFSHAAISYDLLQNPHTPTDSLAVMHLIPALGFSLALCFEIEPHLR